MRLYLAGMSCPGCRTTGTLTEVIPPPEQALDRVTVTCGCGWTGGLWQAEMTSLFELLTELR